MIPDSWIDEVERRFQWGQPKTCSYSPPHREQAGIGTRLNMIGGPGDFSPSHRTHWPQKMIQQPFVSASTPISVPRSL